MEQHTLTTPAEDSAESSDDPIVTAEHAFHAAASVANPPDHEWLMGLYLDPTSRLLGIHQVFSSTICRQCPDAAMNALLDAPVSSSHELIIVRKHIHPWGGPRTQGMRRFRAFRQQAHEKGLYVRDVFVADSTGEVYSLLGEPVFAPRGGLSHYAAGLFSLVGLMTHLRIWL